LTQRHHLGVAFLEAVLHLLALRQRAAEPLRLLFQRDPIRGGAVSLIAQVDLLLGKLLHLLRQRGDLRITLDEV
jgi:hypothetical protein